MCVKYLTHNILELIKTDFTKEALTMDDPIDVTMYDSCAEYLAHFCDHFWNPVVLCIHSTDWVR